MIPENLGVKEVVGKFDGGDISSDGGVMLLAEAEQQVGLLSGFAAAGQIALAVDTCAAAEEGPCRRMAEYMAEGTGKGRYDIRSRNPDAGRCER